MKKGTLEELNVAILVTDGFSQVELTEPRKALDDAGATTRIVSPGHHREMIKLFSGATGRRHAA